MLINVDATTLGAEFRDNSGNSTWYYPLPELEFVYYYVFASYKFPYVQYLEQLINYD